MQPVTFLESQRGNRTLWRAGYRHTIISSYNFLSSWRCRNRNCKGFIRIDEETNTILKARPHSNQCTPDFAMFERQRITCEIKKIISSSDPSIPVKKIYDDFIRQYKEQNPECERYLPKFNMFTFTKNPLPKRAPVNKRAKQVNYPKSEEDDAMMEDEEDVTNMYPDPEVILEEGDDV
ncbi:hypothetical protein O0L34_g17075 [Tuta absoluta]|nr:hypothetical protein O0L34_g17075 [Tuta absoluta]